MTLIVVTFLLPVVLALVGITARWLVRRRRRVIARRPVDTKRRCRCGYEMDQLDTIRCPECGRVFGFDATPEELELTDDQLRRAKAKRDARRAAADDA